MKNKVMKRIGEKMGVKVKRWEEMLTKIVVVKEVWEVIEKKRKWDERRNKKIEMAKRAVKFENNVFKSFIFCNSEIKNFALNSDASRM